jgi:hypothetical protein
MIRARDTVIDLTHRWVACDAERGSLVLQLDAAKDSAWQDYQVGLMVGGGLLAGACVGLVVGYCAAH